MTSGTEHHSAATERLSAVMDGEADEDALLSACSAWRDAADDRACWHAWHLIGDVMRSEDLASTAGRDLAFLAGVRSKLAAEPVVLAPSALARGTQRRSAGAAFGSTIAQLRQRRAWTASAAVAAGFVAVAGAAFVLQRPAVAPQAVLAVSAPSPQLAIKAGTGLGNRPPVAEAVFVPSGQMILNARLQQYLAAHKQFGGAATLNASSGQLRNATVEAPAR